jgi:hypothetical protein
LINKFLQIFGVEISRSSRSAGGSNYITMQETINNAKKAGLSVCDYVEKLWDQKGETKKTIDQISQYRVFDKSNLEICEIGAGTGRYMEKVLEKCNPKSYESYEIAKDWSKWLQQEYPIISQPTDGKSLKSTASHSIDFLHAHGVFVYLPFFNSLRYFKEIDRVTKRKSYIIFDCLTEDCLDDEVLNDWLDSNYDYPSLISEEYIFKFFPSEKYKLLGTFYTKYGQGRSKYFAFEKL